MRDKVRFLLGHELVELDRVDPTQTVLDWLRLDRRRTGTKEGCNEGDCGACTVVVAKATGDRLDYRAVNACIQFVAYPRRLPAPHRRGSEGRGRQPAPGPAGDGRLPRLAVRLLHARLRHVDVRPDPQRRQRCPARRRSTTRSRAISAAAPAMRRSCAQSSRPMPSILAATPSPLRCRRHPGAAARAGRRRRRSRSARAAPVHRSRHRRRAGRGAARRARRHHRRRLYRRRPVGDQADAAARSDRLSRPRARAAADRGDGRRHRHRRRRQPQRRHGSPGSALSRPRRDVAPVRLGADPECRHRGRQHRQRLAHRRRQPVADRRRRHLAAAPRQRSADACRSRISSSPTASRIAARASSSRASPCPGRRPARATAPTRSASASIRTSRR